jgi:HEAT repeat protein
MSFLRNLFGIPDVDEARAKGNVKGLLKALAKSDDADTRSQAAEALGALADPEAIGPLVDALGDESDKAADAAGRALVQVGTPAVESLLSYLQEEEHAASGAWRAASTLGEIGDAHAVPALIEALQNRSLLTRRYAARALGQIGDPRALPALAIALRDEHKDVRSAATGALAAFGESALEAVVAALRDKRPEARQMAAYVLGEIGSRRAVKHLIVALQDRQRQVRESAARALGRVGDERAIPPLFGAMSARRDEKREIDQRIGSDAVQAIAERVGRDAVPALVVILEDRNMVGREAAAKALGKAGDSRAVVPLLRTLYGRAVKLPALSAAAATALDWLRPTPDALAPALEDASAYVRMGTVERLGEMGNAQAVEPLVVLLDDDSIRVRKAAAKALGKLRWKPEATAAGAKYWILRGKWDKCVDMGTPAIGPLIDALTSGGQSKAKMRSAAAQALEKLGWEPGMGEAGARYWIEQGEWTKCAEIGAPAVDPLIEALAEGEAERSHDAAQALGRIGAPAVEALSGLLGSNDDEIRRRAIEALAQIGTPSVVHPLLVARDRNPVAALDVARALRIALERVGPEAILEADVLSDPDVGVRRGAARSLGKAGNTRAVEPLTTTLFEDEEVAIRREAADALGQIGGEQAIAALTGALEGEIWESAAFNLCRIGGPSAIDALVTLLREGSPAARAWTARGLGDTKDARAVDALITALEDREEQVRASAAVSLGSIGDTRAIEPLVAALEDTRKKVREQAAAALERLGWEPTEHKVGPRECIDRGEWEKCVAFGEAAVGPLIDVLNEEDAERREEAVGALSKIGAPAIDPLVRVLAYMGMGPHRRAAAARALGLIADSRAVPGLVDALHQRDADVHKEAALALGRIGDQQALPSLIVALYDRDKEVRSTIQEVLDQMGWQPPEPSDEKLTLAGEGTIGFWLSDPEDASTVVRLLSAQYSIEAPSSLRVVPNMRDTRGGCFAMFGKHRAPGETEADYERRAAANEAFQKGVRELTKGGFESARRLFEETVAWHPYSPGAWNNLASALANLHDNEESIKCCDVAIELDSNYADPWDIKGRCLYRLGRHRDALYATEMFIRLARSQAEYADRIAEAREAADWLRSQL